MLKVRQAYAMLTPRLATAFTAISLRRDGLNAFSKSFLQQVVLHTHFGIHTLQAAVFFSHRFQFRDHRCIHSAKRRPPFIKTGTPLSACFKIPMICASLYRLLFIQNLLRYYAEKILRMNTTNFRGITERSTSTPRSSRRSTTS